MRAAVIKAEVGPPDCHARKLVSTTLVANKLLEKLRVDFTKSRRQHSNDNGLPETKNGGDRTQTLEVQPYSAAFRSRGQYFLPGVPGYYVNFPRLCFFPEADDKEKTRKCYRLKDMMTPYEKLKSLPQAKKLFLRLGITLEQLDQLPRS